MTFLTGFNGFFKVTNSNKNFNFIESVTDKDGYIQTTRLSGSYELESLNNEIKRLNIDEEYYTEVDYPFLKKPTFSTLGSIIELSTQGPVITIVPDDSMGDLLGFRETTK